MQCNVFIVYCQVQISYKKLANKYQLSKKTMQYYLLKKTKWSYHSYTFLELSGVFNNVYTKHHNKTGNFDKGSLNIMILSIVLLIFAR